MIQVKRGKKNNVIGIKSNFAFSTGGCMITRQKSKVELRCDFSLKVTCLYGTIQQMNILSAEVCSLEAVNSGSRNVQTQFTVCSLKLTFSCFIWFHPCVSVGPTPQSLNISFEWPWKWNRKWLDLHSPPDALHIVLLVNLKLVDEGFRKMTLICILLYIMLNVRVPSNLSKTHMVYFCFN